LTFSAAVTFDEQAATTLIDAGVSNRGAAFAFGA
jgi:hypothetical protein